MTWLLTIIGAVTLTIIQISFLSQLPAPWSLISFPIIAVTIAVAGNRPFGAMLWIIVSGILLDLHGLYGFGTQMALLFLAFTVERLLFSRVLTNSSKMAFFLLTSAGVLTIFLGLMLIDAFRVLFGGTPYLLAFEPSVFSRLSGSVVVNGLLVILCLSAIGTLRRRFESVFIPHERH